MMGFIFALPFTGSFPSSVYVIKSVLQVYITEQDLAHLYLFAIDVCSNCRVLVFLFLFCFVF